MLRRTVGVAIAGMLIATSFQTVVARATSDSVCYRQGRAERKLARLTNGARGANLSLDPELSRVAAKHTRVMAKKQRLFHTPDHKLAWRVTRWNGLGENVGVGRSLRSLHRAFMASPGHRANIVDARWMHMGVGVRYRGGRVWATIVFESVQDPGTRVWMPSCSG